MSAAFLAAILFSVASVSASAQNTAAQWQEGEHYDIINEQLNPRLGIVEIFSFWCPHCFQFESIASQLKSKLPEDINFTKAHVEFMRSAPVNIQQEATKMMLVARAINREDSFNKALFKAIHEDKKHFNSVEAIKEILLEQGVDGEKVLKLADSFGMKSRINRNNKLTEGINEVPTFIVNGKYKAKFTRDMTPDSFVELILWLTKQP
ncbi:thiol:disulfide interchange protein DsbA/DsbL [Paraneptunicella aestuarii]|uniref:thiol:disulfide interchange protein DsbA/DsbL n=1 Tax=Paraneptunicella aestuarii TaxID=2831148 RepID=UPI001E313448|nr:thiol:disulfide interchange protein DsbA/DsbL [Paraneptunicella aestuarii]UAA38991.1 thiol:disulfide interchange protein DsbA/DsbL [Paraneptunicella aestuarii]